MKHAVFQNFHYLFITKNSHQHFLQNWATFWGGWCLQIFTQPTKDIHFHSAQFIQDFFSAHFIEDFHWGQPMKDFHPAHEMFSMNTHNSHPTFPTPLKHRGAKKETHKWRGGPDTCHTRLIKKAHKDIQNHGCCSKPELCDLVLFAIVPPPLSTLMTLDVQEIRCQGENLATWYFTGQCIVASLYGEFFFITFSVLVIFSL